MHFSSACGPSGSTASYSPVVTRAIPAYRAAQNVTGGQAVETSRMRHKALNKVTLPTHIRVCRLQIHVATVWTDGRIERCGNSYCARFWLDEAGKVRHTR
jgi:hypothetical protein